MPIIYGESEPTLIRRIRRHDVNTGFFYEEFWRGPIEATEAKFEVDRLDPAIDTTDFSSENGSASYLKIIQDDDGIGGGQTTEELNSYWEVLGVEILKDIRDHPTFSDVSDVVLRQLENARKEVAKANDWDASGESALVQTYVGILRRRTSGYFRSQIILQKTVPLGRRSVIVTAWEGTDEAHAINTVNGPNPTPQIIGNISGHPEFEDGKKQWRKIQPRVQQVTKGGYNIIYQWHFARRWSHTLYNGDDEATNP